MQGQADQSLGWYFLDLTARPCWHHAGISPTFPSFLNKLIWFAYTNFGVNVLYFLRIHKLKIKIEPIEGPRFFNAARTMFKGTQYNVFSDFNYTLMVSIFVNSLADWIQNMVNIHQIWCDIWNFRFVYNLGNESTKSIDNLLFIRKAFVFFD